ncbi:MAG TPA: hypothetical protein GX497_08350 [Bacillus bacterium]|nr:hypothetical protein [Bacillus sp. (in: firmicutes)]
MKQMSFFIIMLVIAIVLGSATKAASTKMIVFRGKIIDFVLIVYIAILLIATVITFGFTIKPESKVERVSDKEIAKAVEAENNFYHYVEAGMLANADGVFVNKEWQFPYEDRRLIITSTAIDGSQAWVVVERKKEIKGDNQIDIIQYMTKSIIDDYDYSHLLEAPKITVNKQEVQIIPTKRTELKLAKFTKEFTISQFTDDQFVNERIFGDVNHVRGQNVLYLRVPASLEVVEGNGAYLQFVN